MKSCSGQAQSNGRKVLHKHESRMSPVKGQTSLLFLKLEVVVTPPNDKKQAFSSEEDSGMTKQSKHVTRPRR